MKRLGQSLTIFDVPSKNQKRAVRGAAPVLASLPHTSCISCPQLHHPTRRPAPRSPPQAMSRAYKAVRDPRFHPFAARVLAQLPALDPNRLDAIGSVFNQVRFNSSFWSSSARSHAVCRSLACVCGVRLACHGSLLSLKIRLRQNPQTSDAHPMPHPPIRAFQLQFEEGQDAVAAVLESRFAQQAWRERIEGAESPAELAEVAEDGVDDLDEENATRLLKARRDGSSEWVVRSACVLQAATHCRRHAALRILGGIAGARSPCWALFSISFCHMQAFADGAAAPGAAPALDASRPHLAALVRRHAPGFSEQQAASALRALPRLALGLGAADIDTLLGGFLRRIIAKPTAFMDPAVVGQARPIPPLLTITHLALHWLTRFCL